MAFKSKICREIKLLGKPSLAAEQAELIIGIIPAGMAFEETAAIQPVKGELQIETLQNSGGAKYETVCRKTPSIQILPSFCCRRQRCQGISYLGDGQLEISELR